MSIGIPKAGGEDGRMMLYLWEGLKNKWRRIICDSVFPQTNIQVFPFQQIWSKSIIYRRLPHPASESDPIPTLDYSSSCSCVRCLFVVIFWCSRSSTRGSRDWLSSTSSLQLAFSQLCASWPARLSLKPPRKVTEDEPDIKLSTEERKYFNADSI